MVAADPYIYEGKPRPSPKTLGLAGVLLCLSAGGLLFPIPLVRDVMVAIPGVIAVLLVVGWLIRPTMLRIDASGISFRTASLYPFASIGHCAWPEVARLVIWPTVSPHAQFIGIERRDDAPPLRGRRTGATFQKSAAVTHPRIPREIGVTGVHSSVWGADRDRLAAAVAHFAPDVQIIDLATGRPLEAR